MCSSSSGSHHTSSRIAAFARPIATRSSLLFTSSQKALLPTSTLSPQDPRTSKPNEPNYSTSPRTLPSRDTSNSGARPPTSLLLIFVLYLYITQIILIFARRHVIWSVTVGRPEDPLSQRSRKLTLKDLRPTQRSRNLSLKDPL